MREEMLVEHGSSLDYVARVKRFRPIRALKIVYSLSELLLWISQWFLFCLICVAWILLSNLSKALRCIWAIELSSSFRLLFTEARRSWRDMIWPSCIVVNWWCSWILIVLSCWSSSNICEVGVLTDCWWLGRRIELLIRILALLLQVDRGR